MSAVMQTAASTMKITKVKEHIGAIVTGIDLSQPVDAETQKKLYDAVVENVVLVIRGQAHLTSAQIQAAGGNLRRAHGRPEPALSRGRLSTDQRARQLPQGQPGNAAKVGKNATWHTDHTNQERPPKFTMLYAIAVPDKGGGDVGLQFARSV